MYQKGKLQSVLDNGNLWFYILAQVNRLNDFMKTYSEQILSVKEIFGSYEAIGRVCGVSGKAVMKWKNKGVPPRTEYTGETNYAELIELATNGSVKKTDLMPPLKKELA
ncbi:MAG: hypothetical protein PHU14_01585 [Methylovulum sp.]|nr:hypothetical protein [Methylovulum sp.]